MEELGVQSGTGDADETIPVYNASTCRIEMVGRAVRSDAEWRAILTPETYRVVRLKGTEPPFTGPYWDCHRNGLYRCACCGTDLFDSGKKFDSGTGWPSFSEVISSLNIEMIADHSLGMMRTEVLCRRCGAHLGHLFEDGPQPTGLRYCMNSWALNFNERPKKQL